MYRPRFNVPLGASRGQNFGSGHGREPEDFQKNQSKDTGQPNQPQTSKVPPGPQKTFGPENNRWKSSFETVADDEINEESSSDKRPHLYDPFKSDSEDHPSEEKLEDRQQSRSGWETDSWSQSLSPDRPLFSAQNTESAERGGYSSGGRTEEHMADGYRPESPMPPSQQMPPPPHQMPPPPHQMPPPSHQMPPPPHQMPPPSHQMPPPSHQMPPPSHQMPPPSHQMPPPSHQMPPPSHQMPPPQHLPPPQYLPPPHLPPPHLPPPHLPPSILKPPPSQRNYPQSSGFAAGSGPPPRPEAQAPSKNALLTEKNLMSCDLCEVEVSNGQELEEHLDSKTHWDTLEFIQKNNKYDDMAIAFLQDVMLYKSQKCSRAIDHTALQALQEYDHMTKVEMFHCAPCNVFVPTSAPAVKNHISTQQHRNSTKEFEARQRRLCLDKASTMMEQLMPQFQAFVKGVSPFE
ncbi:unnamed protein product [Knipowitschia caucasica]|uniref:C2H2-type domain-containing protein n=1 Tax=Knipowitschia caucasica TaxID=637954 RepID=A0AAV2JTH3_KNICA